MSEENKPIASRFWGRLLIIAALLILFIGIVGFMWSQSRQLQEHTQLSEPVVQRPEIKGASGIDEVDSEVIMPRASATAPLLPTAIATAVPTVISLPLPSFDNPVEESFKEEAALWDAVFINVTEENSGAWQYEVDNFVHAVALEISGDNAYLVDGGRVLLLNLDKPQPPRVLLAPGDEIDGVRVLEPLDLSLMDERLFVLDRAGDVYQYDLASQQWKLDRYDRPIEASSGHYFVAIDVSEAQSEAGNAELTRTLLETSYKFTMQYAGDDKSLWNLPEARAVDVSVLNDEVLVLQREMFESTGLVTKYYETRLIEDFEPATAIDTPRQIVATETAIYVLDKAGRRLLALDPADGNLLQLFQLPQTDPISVFAVDSGGRLVLAGRDRLYFYDQPDRIAAIQGAAVSEGPQLYDPSYLQELDDFTVPIRGSNITFRDFQMPGAPRHYRLGIHEGMDLYWQPGTKVVAAADGLIIRADLDYSNPSAVQLASWWNETQEVGYTSRETLDYYMGRQVWIQHDSGLVTRYGHLRSIEPGIAEGDKVSRGQIIGEVGNSGSPAALESESSDAHLHFELWMDDAYLGQFMRPIETREWIENIFPNR